MTADPRELDATPAEPWRETSSPGIRRLAIEATRAAVRAAQERQPSGETGDAREPAPASACGTNSAGADTVSSDAGQNAQRAMRGSE